MNVAYFSPLNPQRSGISDYSEELLPFLAQDAEITLFVDGFKPANQAILTGFQWFDYGRDPSHLTRLDQFEAIVYHMGNDHRYHAGILEAIRAHPGILVLHDFALQDFFLGLARERGDPNLYLEEVEACHGPEARAEAAETLTRGAAPAIVSRPLEFPLSHRLARCAEAIIVHSQWSRRHLARIVPDVSITHIPMPVRTLPQKRESAVGREVQISNFGLVTPGKGIERALEALSVLKQTHNFHYTLVGATNSYFDVRELIRRYGLESRVEITGYVSLEEFERRIGETDIALNLRERTVGETSASLCRIMATGVCSIVSDVGWYAELPDDSVVKIPVCSSTDALLLAYLERLIADEALRSRIGKNARQYILEENNIERSARAYLDLIRKVVALGPRRKMIAQTVMQLSALEIPAGSADLLRGVASEIAVLTPETSVRWSGRNSREAGRLPPLNGHEAQTALTSEADKDVLLQDSRASTGRLLKLEGVDYKRAAVEYLRKLDPERSHYLKTKPFYNLANKPAKHRGDGMDSETHRHFSDFANIAVALALPAGARILDVGCGSGWLSEYFARLGYDVTGTDISDELVAMAAERVAGIPYNVDHETPLRCRFMVQDIEAGPLLEKFDAVICYDSLHHMEDERAVLRNFAAMLDHGGLLFILEGHKPPANSPTEAELCAVMRRYETLESPFSYEYLLELLDQNGFAVVGDYVSVNGLFERDMLEDNALPLRTLPVNYHYLTCMKVAAEAPATSVPSSRRPGMLRAQISLLDPVPATLEPGAKIDLPLEIKNTGDTLWLTGQTVRAGVVMPAVKVFDEHGNTINEFHGEPMLPRAVAPGQSVRLRIEVIAPLQAGAYSIKIDLVNQHICWFEDRGSPPLTIAIEVVER